MWPCGRSHHARGLCWRRAHVVAGLRPLVGSRDQSVPRSFGLALAGPGWLRPLLCGCACTLPARPGAGQADAMAAAVLADVVCVRTCTPSTRKVVVCLRCLVALLPLVVVPLPSLPCSLPVCYCWHKHILHNLLVDLFYHTRSIALHDYYVMGPQLVSMWHVGSCI
jgi:hypothetical protein